MHPQSAHPQHSQVLYRQPFQNSNLVPVHIPQPHYTNVHFVHRIDAPNVQSNIPKPKSEHQKNIQNQINFNLNITSIAQAIDFEVDHQNFRKENNRNSNCGNYPPEPLSMRSQPYNGESRQLSTSRAQGQQIEKPKTIMQIRRKDSINTNNARQVREEYYKGQQQIDQLMSKLPQIQIQTLNKTINHNARNFHLSPSTQMKSKQVRKATSPYTFHSRSISLKDNNGIDSVYFKKTDTQQNLTGSVRSISKQSTVQNNGIIRQKSNQVLRFHSPLKTHQPPRKLNQEVDVISPNLNPQRVELEKNKERDPISSRCISRKQSITDTSNSTSMCFQTQQLRSTGWSTNFTAKLGEQIKKNCLQKQSQTENRVEQNQNIEELKRFQSKVENLQHQLESQKSQNYLKQLTIKTLQHEINSLKINSQKKILQLQKQLTNKKQTEVSLLREDYEKKIAKLNLQAKENKERFCLDIKEMQDKWNVIISTMEDNMKIGVQKIESLTKQNCNFTSKLEDSNEKIAIYIARNAQLEQEKRALLEKIESFQKKTSTLQQKIGQLQNCLANKKKTEIKNTGIMISNGQTFSKIDIQRLHRRLQEQTSMLYERDQHLKNLIKDLRTRDRQILDLKKANDSSEKLMRQYCDDVLRLRLREKNAKYEKYNQNDCNSEESINKNSQLPKQVENLQIS